MPAIGSLALFSRNSRRSCTNLVNFMSRSALVSGVMITSLVRTPSFPAVMRMKPRTNRSLIYFPSACCLSLHYSLPKRPRSFRRESTVGAEIRDTIAPVLALGPARKRDRPLRADLHRHGPGRERPFEALHGFFPPLFPLFDRHAPRGP